MIPAAAAGKESAEAAFDRGLADMEAGRYETGCPALAESFRLDPKPGALFTQATCEARWGKLATAVAHYEEFLQRVAALPPAERARHEGREEAARAQLAELSPRVPRLTLVLPPSAPRGTAVTLDGTPLDAARLGAEMPVDPGEHTITTRAPGRPAHALKVVADAGRAARVVLTVPPEPATATPAPSRRPLAYAAGGLGVAGLLVGAIAGSLAIGRRSVVDAHCTGRACDAEGKAAGDAGKTLAAVSTVGFVVGAAGIGVGVLLLVSEPKPANAAARAALVVRMEL
jgi:hypothetical protein